MNIIFIQRYILANGTHKYSADDSLKSVKQQNTLVLCTNSVELGINASISIFDNENTLMI
jgi:hypothetical protein